MHRPHDPAEIEAVRSELQRLGYLSHRVERYLLQDALRLDRPLLTVLLLAAKVGVLGGVMLAIGGAVLLLAWNPGLASVPFDLPLLALHLLPLGSVVTGVAFLGLAAVLTAIVRFRPGVGIEALSLLVGFVGGTGLLLLTVWRGRELLAALETPAVALFGVAATAAAYLLGRLLYHGLLALAIRLTDRAPGRRPTVRRYLLPATAGAVVLLVLVPVALAARQSAPTTPGVIPVRAGDRVLLLGIDGVLAEELDYLLARGELPALAGLRDGGVLGRYRRADQPPAAFWTTVATGLESPDHGVAAVDSFRPLGMETALATSGPFRWYWADVEQPLGLARHRPLLANRRSAWTFWELLARGGAPVAVVDWWGTYPASDLPGMVVAHGADPLIAAGDTAALAPAARRDELIALQRQAHAGGEEASIAIARAALPAAEAQRLLDVALLPERFYRLAFALGAGGDAGLAERPGDEGLQALAGDGGAAAPPAGDVRRAEPGSRPAAAAALYLPALDLAADGWQGGAIAFAELARAELGAADRLLAGLLASGEWGTVAVVVDPGRRGGRDGRVLLWRRAGCRGGAPSPRIDPAALPEIAPVQVASGLFRAAGLPQSAELPSPPEPCTWPAPPSSMASFGRRQPTSADAGSSDEYLQNLRSLGYL